MGDEDDYLRDLREATDKLDGVNEHGYYFPPDADEKRRLLGTIRRTVTRWLCDLEEEEDGR